MSNFNDFFSKINSSEIKYLEEKRKNIVASVVLITFVIIFTITTLLILFSTLKDEFFLEFVQISFIALPMLYYFPFLKYKNYKKLYNISVVKNLVNSIDNNVEYIGKLDPNIEKQEIRYIQNIYDKCRKEDYDEFVYEDFVRGKILSDNQELNVKILEVATYINNSRYNNENLNTAVTIAGILTGDARVLRRSNLKINNNTHLETVFQGVFATVKLSNSYDGFIEISEKKFLQNNSEDKINLDSPEFEKLFNVFSDDQIRVRQLLTADIMQNILEYRKKFNCEILIRIFEDNICFKFKTGKLFEPKLFKSVIDVKELYMYYDIINLIYTFPEAFITSLKNIN